MAIGPRAVDAVTLPLAWSAGLGATLLSLVLAFAVSGFLVDGAQTSVLTAGATEFFLKHTAGDCHPEPREQLGYVLFIALWIPIFICLLPAIRKAATQAFIERLAAWTRGTGLFMLIFLGIRKNDWLKYFPYRPGTVLTGALFALLSWFWISRTSRPRLHYYFSCLIISSWALLHSIFTEGSLNAASSQVTFHLPFAYNEFLPILAGKTPLVDFYPQYVRLLPYLGVPYFSVTGFSILSFTILMSLLNLTGLMAVARMLDLLFQKRQQAIVAFVAVVGLMVHRDPSESMLSTATYHAVAPFRLLGPLLTLWLCAEQLARPRGWKIMACVSVATVSVLNNLDFGLPAWAAAMAALLFQRMQDQGLRNLSRWRALALNVLYWLGVSGAVTGLFAWWLQRGGHPANWKRLSEFQRIFALHGFYMIKLPVIGLHLPVIGAFLCTLGSACVLRGRWAPFRLAISIFGLGAMAYYVGRSHGKVLGAEFGILALALASLVPPLLSTGASMQSRFALFLFFSAGLQGIPGPFDQLAKIRSLGTPMAENVVHEHQAELSWLRTHIPLGTPVLFMQPSGHHLALELGLKNILPFASEGSLILKSQVREAFELAAESDVTWIALTELHEELEAELRHEGFAQAGRFGATLYWKKATSSNASNVPAPAAE